jgi:hypothetical protein
MITKKRNRENDFREMPPTPPTHPSFQEAARLLPAVGEAK